MSHRMALAASIALTVMLAIGVIGARDRLFADELTARSPVVVPDASGSIQAGGKVAPGTDAAAAPRVIEVQLPAQRGEDVLATDDRSERARSDDDDEHEREDSVARGETEGEDDD